MNESTTTCSVCRAPSSLYLCNTHIGYLRDALDEIPWLWKELQTTLTRTDRLNMGVQGRKSSESPSVINWGASSLASEIDVVLTRWVATLVAEHGLQFMPAFKVPEGFIGPLLQGWDRMDRPGYSGSPAQRAVWLGHHVNTIAGREDARDWYFGVIAYTGEPNQDPQAPPRGLQGKLVDEVNKKTRTWAGRCPQIVGYGRTGEPVECGETLHAFNGSEDAECKACKRAEPPRHCTVNVKENLQRALMAQDVLPEKRITELMAGLGTPVYSDDFQRWLKTDRLQPEGYLHHDRIVDERISKRDARLFSLNAVKRLRQQDRKQVAS